MCPEKMDRPQHRNSISKQDILSKSGYPFDYIHFGNCIGDCSCIVPLRGKDLFLPQKCISTDTLDFCKVCSSIDVVLHQIAIG